jgi:hypothetical protein
MTDRYAGYIVVLEDNIREDDAAHVINAIRMVKGVLSVAPVPDDYQQYIAERRRDDQWREALRTLLYDGPIRLAAP